MYQDVGLVAFSNRDGHADTGKKRHPTIDDGVTIYANATILGDITVGHRCVVGGNVWLTESLPPDTRVAIEPPRLQLKSKAGG